MDVSEREQIDERAHQANERMKLKHEALNRHEKKLKMKDKKPRTAIGGQRGIINVFDNIFSEIQIIMTNQLICTIILIQFM